MVTKQAGYESYRIEVTQEMSEAFTHFYFAENKSGEAITKTLLPSFQTILIFSFGAKPYFTTQQNTKIYINKCLLIGPVKQAFQYTLPTGSKLLAVNFKGDAFYRFFGNALLREDLAHPDQLLHQNCFSLLWEQLNKINEVDRCVQHILTFSKDYLKQQSGIAKQLTAFTDESINPIKSIAKNVHQSERNIQLTHKKVFGYSSKEINRYQRFLKAIELINVMTANEKKPDWFEVVHACGYYDQSQLIHDFRHYLHLSPAKYLTFQRDICNPVS